MLDRNEDSSKPDKPERPLQLKKSRTITGEDATPIFPGPLFPAVRRISTIPSSHNWPPNRHQSIASNAAADHRDFSDRDWVFPSFVLPQNASKRSSKKHGSSDSRAKGADASSHPITSQLTGAADASSSSDHKPEAKRKTIKLVPPPGREGASTSELTRPSSRSRTREFKPFLLLLLVSYFRCGHFYWVIWIVKNNRRIFEDVTGC